MADSILTFDDGDFGFNDYAASPLCVPQDPIDEIELYPNFLYDSISLARLDNSLLESETPCDADEQILSARVMKRKRVALQDCSYDLLTANKKQRGKREGKRSWSMTQVSFCDKFCQRRRCSHCKTTETPQWRMGPLGPKTLCNACGIRSKSGRLLPEYRPAASPTFDSHIHSNFHRKIIKKRG